MAGAQNQQLVDLHVHSTVSDGSCTPEELVDIALAQDVCALALCDHDTTSGLDRFLSYARTRELTAIPGLEISATWEEGNCHILGLGVTPGYGPLENTLGRIRESRNGRNAHIIAKLNGLGLKISLDEVRKRAGGEVLARPHMAQVMVDKGYVATAQEAFDRYLAKGGPAYVDRFRLDPADAVRLLVQAGALAVLAHPSQLKLSFEDLDALVARLVPSGLSAIEAYTPYDPPATTEAYLSLCRRNDLLATGGLDFHGHSKPQHRLGYASNNQPIPRSCLDGLLTRLPQFAMSEQ